jgi:hypothetical protein
MPAACAQIAQDFDDGLLGLQQQQVVFVGQKDQAGHDRSTGTQSWM